MSEQRPSDVLGALPRRRPHRRSAKRRTAAPADSTALTNGAAPAARPATPTARTPATATPTAQAPAKAAPAATPRARPQRLAQPAQPAGVPSTPRRRPAQSSGRHLLGTAAQAAAELAEIGLSVGARTLRGVVDRLPRP